jgi:hypothetical protein
MNNNEIFDKVSYISKLSKCPITNINPNDKNIVEVIKKPLISNVHFKESSNFIIKF